ncbi:hypothetical protein L6164_027380 [Bauhinia variegata]|uniref:Uncharacterized protein n=1 Tax=Bauhinia variegata TaxID=167791 RepID=A0ACB9LT42_BAUVA|nr:hypothetical protein L6164_027380 [Bauhinia variegata]
MNLNCLTCQLLPRKDSDKESDGVQEKNRSLLRLKVERSWSVNLTPGESDAIANVKTKKKTQHRRGLSTGAIDFPESRGPRLVRSCGMRRDWNIEELGEKKEKKVRFR